jgi:hypothetical protein
VREININQISNNMKTIASILVKGVKQRFYFNDTVFLEGDTEFEIEFFNKSQRTVCPSLTINGESLSSSPVIYNGQKFILKDFISDTRKFLFKVYEVDSNDADVKEAIKDNGIISIRYYYEKVIEQKIIKQIHPESSEEIDYSPGISRKLTDDKDSRLYSLPPSSDDSPSVTSDMDLKEETGKITKGSPSGVTYKTVNIEIDYNDFETQIIKLLPFSKKPKFINCPQCQYKSKIEANYCEECGHKY